MILTGVSLGSGTAAKQPLGPRSGGAMWTCCEAAAGPAKRGGRCGHAAKQRLGPRSGGDVGVYSRGQGYVHVGVRVAAWVRAYPCVHTCRMLPRLEPTFGV